MSKKLTYVLGLAIALSLAIGSSAFASATVPTTARRLNSHGPHALMVILDSVSGTTLTVTARGGNAGITTVDASNAKILVKGATADASALKAGDRLMILGTVNGTSVAATRITDGAQASIGSGIVSGVVTAVSGDTMTVSASQHAHGRARGDAVANTTSSVTVTTDAKTMFSIPGTKSATIADVVVGSRVFVIGVDSTTGTGTARFVSVSPVAQHTRHAPQS